MQALINIEPDKYEVFEFPETWVQSQYMKDFLDSKVSKEPEHINKSMQMKLSIPGCIKNFDSVRREINKMLDYVEKVKNAKEIVEGDVDHEELEPGEIEAAENFMNDLDDFKFAEEILEFFDNIDQFSYSLNWNNIIQIAELAGNMYRSENIPMDMKVSLGEVGA